MVIENNTIHRPPPMLTSSVVYKFNYNYHYCKSEYIGHTRLNLEKRLQAHYYNGSMKTHYQHNHDRTLTKEIIKQNTIIFSKKKVQKASNKRNSVYFKWTVFKQYSSTYVHLWPDVLPRLIIVYFLKLYNLSYKL